MSDLQTREQHLLAMENYAAVRARVWIETPKLVAIAPPPQPVAVTAVIPVEIVKRLFRKRRIAPKQYHAASGDNLILQMRSVVAIIAAKHMLTSEDIYSKRRHGDRSLVRALCCYVLRSCTDWSLPRIGRFLGGIDHSSVLYAVRRAKKLISAGLVCDPIPLLFPGVQP